MAVATGAHKTLPTLKDRPVWIRAFAECASTLLYYNAIIQIPIATANAVLQTIPLAIVAVAALVFGEKVGWRRWSVILFGFFGVLLIVGKAFKNFNEARPPRLFCNRPMLIRFFTLIFSTCRTQPVLV